MTAANSKLQTVQSKEKNSPADVLLTDSLKCYKRCLDTGSSSTVWKKVDPIFDMNERKRLKTFDIKLYLKKKSPTNRTRPTSNEL